MPLFSSLHISAAPSLPAPDGSAVRPLLALGGGSMAHFELHAGQTARAVVHRSVEELWFVLSGSGEIWRKQQGTESITELTKGVCISIPVGTQFQFRALAGHGLKVVAVTLPPWPGPEEAIVVEGPWAAGEVTTG